MDTYTPPHSDPISYHDSAHCLRFSDQWFTVYDLELPKVGTHCCIKGNNIILSIIISVKCRILASV